jgi:hypothetical protein
VPTESERAEDPPAVPAVPQDAPPAHERGYVLQQRRNHDTFDFYRVDVEEHPELARRFGVAKVRLR